MTADEKSLHERVAQLEMEVSQLHEELRSLRQGAADSGRPRRVEPPIQISLKQAETTGEAREFGVRDWVDKVGIGLLLIGVLFLLKYSYDQGWLNDLARIGIGAFVGAVLLGTGAWIRESNRHLSAVLMGGAVAVFYGVVYSAFALYDFIPYSTAFALMQAVTLGGCFLAIRQHYAVLGSLAAIGAFATPFALHQPDTGPVFLATYAAIVALGMVVIYLLRGWRIVLLTTSLGAWAVVLIAAIYLDASDELFQTVIVVVAIAALTVTMALAPALAARFRHRPFREFEALHPLLSSTLAAVIIYGILEPYPAALIGFIAAMAVLLFGLSRISWFDGALTKRTMVVSASALAALIVALMVEVNLYAQALLVIGVGANYLAIKDTGPARPIGLAAMGILGVWCLMLRIGSVEGLPYLNPVGLQLIFATMGVLIIGRTFNDTTIRWTHYWTSLAAGLSIVIHQQQGLDHGAMISTCIWGAVALLMLVYGMFKGHRSFQLMGLVTIVATAAKLLIFDLHAVDVIWRMGLFMGFGIIMLLLSAMMPRWKSE